MRDIIQLHPFKTHTFERLKRKYKDNIVYGQQRGGVFYMSTNIDRVSCNHAVKTSDAEKSSIKKAC